MDRLCRVEAPPNSGQEDGLVRTTTFFLSLMLSLLSLFGFTLAARIVDGKTRAVDC